MLTEYVGLAQNTLNALVGLGSNALAERVDSYASIGHKVAQTLRAEGQTAAADATDALGTRGNAMAMYLRSQDGRALWNGAQEAMRGRRWVMGGIGLAAGFLAARTIRWSAPPKERDPMVMLLSGVAASFLIGAFVPLSRFEREQLGVQALPTE